MERGFDLAPLWNEGGAVEYDLGAPKPSAAECAAARAKRAAREAAWTTFAKRMAAKLNRNGWDDTDDPGRGYGYYEVSHETLIEDIMRIEADLREEIAAATPELK